VIRLRQICRDYTVGGQIVHALDHIDLDVQAGEYISIMGPSGSGKSTLLNIVGLLDRQTAGTYELSGKDVTTLDDGELAAHRQAEIGFIFQSFHLIARMTALENVELPLVLAGRPQRRRRERARAMLDSVGLSTRLDHRPDQLSGGERQRVAIARAIVMEPGVLLADEPTGNLDSRSGAEIIDIVEALNRDGIALLVVTHDPNLGDRAERRIQMHDGRIIGDQTGASGDGRSAGDGTAPGESSASADGTAAGNGGATRSDTGAAPAATHPGPGAGR
jgi:putative ABC transport system ATP-binding protein